MCQKILNSLRTFINTIPFDANLLIITAELENILPVKMQLKYCFISQINVCCSENIPPPPW